jgi:hypothetical protein
MVIILKFILAVCKFLIFLFFLFISSSLTIFFQIFSPFFPECFTSSRLTLFRIISICLACILIIKQLFMLFQVIVT